MGAALGALLAPTPLVAASCLPGSSFCEKPNVDPNSGTLEAADLLEAPEHFSFSRGNWGRAARQLQAAQQLRAAAMPSEEQRGGENATSEELPAGPSWHVLATSVAAAAALAGAGAWAAARWRGRPDRKKPKPPSPQRQHKKPKPLATAGPRSPGPRSPAPRSPTSRSAAKSPAPFPHARPGRQLRPRVADDAGVAAGSPYRRA